MRALTLRRPWDEPIVDGVKTVENRSWHPPAYVVGTHIAIHAGQKYDSGGADWIEEETPYVTLPVHESDRVRRGAIVGVVRVRGWIAMQGPTLRYVGDCEWLKPRLDELISSPWFFGPVGWVIDDAVSIAPVPCRGRQRLWTLPADVERVVRERWGEARAACATS